MPADPNKPKATRKGYAVLHVAGKWWQYMVGGRSRELGAVVAYSMETTPIKLLGYWDKILEEGKGDENGWSKSSVVSNWIWREMNNP